jgi:hypothetical protein
MIFFISGSEGGPMARSTGISCFHISAANAIIVLFTFLFSSTVSAGEKQMIFTDDDLLNYKTAPIVDQETQAGLEESVLIWEKQKAAEEKLKSEELKKKALQKQRQEAEETRRAELQETISEDVNIRRIIPGQTRVNVPVSAPQAGKMRQTGPARTKIDSPSRAMPPTQKKPST